MSYFGKFGTVNYKFSDGTSSVINDLTKFATFRDTWLNEPRVQLKYKIRDGELPHIISQKIYDTVDYWWTVLLFNNIINFEDQWPRTPEELDKYIAEKYPFYNSDEPHHFILPNGTITDLRAIRLDMGLDDDLDAVAAAGLSWVTIYDHELEMNEEKRDIILIDPDFISTVAKEFEEIMNG